VVNDIHQRISIITGITKKKKHQTREDKNKKHTIGEISDTFATFFDTFMIVHNVLNANFQLFPRKKLKEIQIRNNFR
jgi:hypothetical protein